MSAIVIDGGIVHYEYLGRGSPIIFIHGWLGSWRYWMPSMGELSDSYRTYALDLWGFGDTDKMESRYAVSEYVQLVLAFMDELGISHAPLIVGHSLGAVVALNMALSYPEMMARLVLVSLPFGAQQINTKSLLDGKSIAGGGLFKKPKEYQPVMAEVEKTDKQAIALSVSSLNGFDVLGKLSSLQVPTVMLYGAKDPIVSSPQPAALSEMESAGVQGSTVRAMCMAQSRHFPMLEEATTFNRLLRDFLLTDVVSNPEMIYSLEFKEEWRRRMR